MNNKIEVIGIDHGWSNMKTSSQVFTTGVKEITTEPALFDGVLEYKLFARECITQFVSMVTIYLQHLLYLWAVVQA